MKLTIEKDIIIDLKDKRITLEKGDKILIHEKKIEEKIAEFEISLRDAKKAKDLVDDIGYGDSRIATNAYSVGDQDAFEELRDLFDSYNIEYDIKWRR